MQIVPAFPARPRPEQLAEGVCLEDKGMTLAYADPLQRGKGRVEEGAADAFSPGFSCDGEVLRARPCIYAI
jgi:hypothetical protein